MASDLARKASALEDELVVFERVGREAWMTPLDSQKNLERARRLLDKLADAETVLNGKAGDLARLLGALRDRQQESADRISGWARELQEKIESFNAVQARFAQLGSSASGLQEALQKASGDPAALEDVTAQLHALAERSGDLADEAKLAGFKDLQRDAEARRSQLTSSARKLDELRARL